MNDRPNEQQFGISEELSGCVRVCLQLNTDWTQVEVITLVNDGTGLGFGIIGGKSTGVVVKTILPGGVADRVTISSPCCCGY